MRTLLLIALCFTLLTGEAISQSNQKKITPQDYIEANEFARTFWTRLVRTKDIKPLLKEYAIENYYRCLNRESFAFVQDDQVRSAKVPLLERYYVAETNFMLLFFLWSNSRSGSKEYDEADTFSVLPSDVRKIITKQTWDAINKNDSSSDPDRPQSDKDANEYFDRLLNAFEKANPVLRKHAIKIRAGKNALFQKNIIEFEKDATYAFRPELSSQDRFCGSSTKSETVIIVDIPFFQLALKRVEGELRVVALPFHID